MKKTCIALASDDRDDLPRVLLDCGASSLTAMRQQKIDPNEIDTVLVSHLHGDHFGGVPFLVLDGQFRHRTRDLHVDRRAVELAWLRVTPFEVRHASGAPAYALRADGPTSSLSYSGDTEWTDALLDAAHGVDLFLCEGYSPFPGSLAPRPRYPCPAARPVHLHADGAHSPIPTALASNLADWQIAHDGSQFDL